MSTYIFCFFLLKFTLLKILKSCGGYFFHYCFLRNVKVRLLFHSTPAPAESYENLREGDVGYPYDPEKEELLDKLKSGESRHIDASALN